ncbi:bifunctional diaminohydroxyphosphoribosylaminopyrimidine deaminase/5-amino-6-(5-phosphoribosylamino)uracil reductase RibD [Pseudogulbenkiania ferrooxidans]|uniref:Riboflavin biosynthesis protein RibD n=1 Tax=Pseudogulbenkiania ferrooxidans 2002 TaxID=279714 RepID=B9Z110_9NEIS|nr:bifunctional diaminohydroxyphosphoribosylaminopyrimidine deaminase/5-amino-6-(5-phosphoribosylamino)uracil reductase RibD [Pseudogulbenkiania ferrooxidans]EEG09105.1 riboflavin biosynthesis protein RibD [Pseudogulbenkiania ferrooxidans 2002]
MTFSAVDHAMMAQALRLAEQGLYTTTPNPRVGCVVVRDGEVVGEGWHIAAGTPHAEVHALRMAGELARGATAYVTLEPCSHYGRTPPCAKGLIEAGVGRVVAAMQDPYHEVAGRGLDMLRAAGIEVAVGLLEAEARRLNKGFLSRAERGRPWVTLKAAASLDGKTALLNGASQWITGPDARRDVHRLRARSCAILTGSGTVLADDPQLTVREVFTPRQPRRVVVDSRLQTSPGARIYRDGETILATAVADAARHQPYLEQGVTVWVLGDTAGRVDLAALLARLAQEGVGELMVEAGAGLNGALLQAGLVDEIMLYLAPTLLGDAAQGLFGWPVLESLAGKRNVVVRDLRMVGQDVRLELAIPSC